MTQIPPAGPTLSFDAWTRIVVDAFTAGNVARTLIGYFEPSKSRGR